MRLGRTPFTALSVITLATGLAACGETAEEVPTAELAAEDLAMIEARQDNFEEIGDAFKVIRDQLDADSPDFALISASAATIQEDAAKIPDFFVAGTSMDSGADTEALAVIWEQPEDFTAAHQKLVDASAVLVEAAASEDAETIGAAAMGLGGSCKNCHDTFRLETD